MAASNPVKLRKQELELEKLRSSTGQKMTRSPSRKRHQSVTYREESPEGPGFGDNQSRMSQGYGAPASILKSGRKQKKTRPKTAQRARSGYNPSRGVGGGRGFNANKQVNNDYSPKSANAGISFSPYTVPNVAKIPTPNRLSSKQVSFAGNGR